VDVQPFIQNPGFRLETIPPKVTPKYALTRQAASPLPGFSALRFRLAAAATNRSEGGGLCLRAGSSIRNPIMTFFTERRCS
jgi:hypothetical protein